ncbi:MAG: hypothetical protein J7474_03190, partial [Arthrobacter sp.]|nr:hypothetical protein [Arthrobacter sp.]
GAGHADKNQIRVMLGVLLPKADPPTPDAAASPGLPAEVGALGAKYAKAVRDCAQELTRRLGTVRATAP